MAAVSEQVAVSVAAVAAVAAGALVAVAAVVISVAMAVAVSVAADSAVPSLLEPRSSQVRGPVSWPRPGLGVSSLGGSVHLVENLQLVECASSL